MLKKATLFSCAVLLARVSLAQFTPELSKVIPPSPNSQQFEKYGSYPVSNFTGIPDISIPIYTVKEGDLTVPITLSYHASGTRPYDLSSFVGLGWTLNTGGKITRTIMDKGDESLPLPSTFYTAEQLSQMTNFEARNYQFKQWNQTNDVEPDIFSYNLNGLQGKFIFKQDLARTPLLLPYKPISIKHNLPSGGVGTIHFDITDEKGIKYKFDSSEFPDIFNSNEHSPTAFDLVEMTSAIDPSNKIIFTPQSGPNESYFFKRIDQWIADDEQDASFATRYCYATAGAVVGDRDVREFMEYTVPENSSAGENIGYSGTYPYQVIFRSGKVEFTHYTANNNLKDMLSSVTVYDKNANVLRSLEFVYLDKGLGKALLKEIKLYDGQHAYLGSYKFEYFSEERTIPPAMEAGMDYWGYYNGNITQNWTQLFPTGWQITFPEGNRPTRSIGTGSRVTNLDYMKTHVLSKISYPTGGFTTFDFEANQYTTAQTTGPIPYYSGTDVGGLRIKAINNYKSVGATPETKTYQYSPGIMDFLPGNIDDYSYTQVVFIPDWGEAGGNHNWNGFRRRYFRSEPSFNLTPHGSSVVYEQVTEYIGDGQNNVGKTVFNYDYAPAEKVYYPSNGQTTQMADNILYKPYLRPFKEWLSGNLVSKHTYSNAGGTYKLTSSENYNYADSVTESVRGFLKDRFVEYTTDQCTYPAPNINPDDFYPTHSSGYSPTAFPYNFGDYYVTSGYRRLSSTETATFDAGGTNGVWTMTKYNYSNPLHDQPTSTTVFRSVGDSIITRLKYPHDFASTQPYTEMVNRHIWSPVIEQISYKNTTSIPLQSVKNTYSFWQSNILILPSLVSTKYRNDAYEPRIQFDAYDEKANLLQQRKAGDGSTCYIWGYNKLYPKAQIINAQNTEVWHENFEEGGGNSAFNDSKTGHYSKKGGYIQGLSGLTPGKYTLSYWTKQGGQWTFIVQDDVSVNTTYNINIGSAYQVDDVRFYPQDALMTTYTYEPSIGMTSTTDASGITTYYEYDGLQRLKTIKDQSGSVVKTFNYHYKGQ